jgi:ferritin-like metal-binding protein YciE
MYSVEQQALAQLVSAPKIAGDPQLAEKFRDHYGQTQQERAMMHRLEAGFDAVEAASHGELPQDSPPFLAHGAA